MYSDVDEGSGKRRAKGSDGVVGAIKSGAVGFGSLAFVVVFFPVLVLGSAAILLFLLWPLFLGAHLQYGYVPGTNVRGRETVTAVWYLATFVWLVGLAVVPLAVRRYWESLQLRRVRSVTARPFQPRAR
ncbi:hypothetical protein AArcCO_2612 [Halalkaliarchaeum sp. AArc-CO]|uniref:hypothetical protein n=1 Tax=unclassified Halalkaliarchaeum TaxID=2678344 RepID=UPI00217DB6EA|nr:MULTISPECIES: hypothetical protein [unclassified Halalkaliarchaeum]MDR5674476.1 hypothetical protein [Halalkaliarchaeum sp. AArc-GB]UWG51895.1 hypothetical protein AArcCO_2612 [Halalkaliarchaeum sp. AArc-CO]